MAREVDHEDKQEREFKYGKPCPTKCPECDGELDVYTHGIDCTECEWEVRM